MKKSKSDDNLFLEDKAKKELKKLYSEVKKHDGYYYTDHNPKILDSEYDELRRSILKLEKNFPSLILPNSPSFSVGAEPSGKFGKVKSPFQCYLSKTPKVEMRLFRGMKV